MLARLLRWTVALAAGAATWWGIRSPIAALVACWYALESLTLIAILLAPGRTRQTVTRVLVRAVGSALAFATAYLALAPWEEVIAGAYTVLVILEALYSLLSRRRQRASPAPDNAGDAARTQTDDPTPSVRRKRTWIPTALCAVLFVAIVPPTATFFAAREVILDTRFYLSQLERPEVYDEALRLAGDAALSAARGQGATVRRAVALLSEEDVRQAAELLLPTEWTEAVIEQALDGTLSWLQADDASRVPALSLPVQDVKRHATEATSTVLDRQMAALPLCTPETPRATLCRPSHQSVAAYAASRKPALLGLVDGVFALFPAEVDLATVVTMAPRPFQEPLDALAETREILRTVDRALAAAGIVCLSLLTLLAFLGAVGPRTAAGWAGGALLVAGMGTWGGTRALPAFAPEAILARLGPEGILESPTVMTAWAVDALEDLFGRVHALLSPWALCLGGIGLALLLVWAIVLRSRSRPLTGWCAGRVVATFLAVGLLAWTAYLRLGRDMVDHALQEHRGGDAEGALALYQQAERAYPFAWHDFVVQARQEARECKRFLEAESAYREGAHETAVGAYEALLVGTPAITLQEQAREHLLASLYAWGRTLQGAGEQERALDRYRFIRDEYRDRAVHQAMTDLYLGWGEALAEEADYQAAIATYRRIPQEVANPRLWSSADATRATSSATRGSSSTRAAPAASASAGARSSGSARRASARRRRTPRNNANAGSAVASDSRPAATTAARL